MVVHVTEAIRKMVQHWFPTSGQTPHAERAVIRRLGGVVITSKAQAGLASYEVIEALLRHFRGDDGDLDEFASRTQEKRALEGFRRLSVFRSANGGRFWLITEADRSRTTILLPEEF